MGASLWHSQKSGYYQPGYGYSENETGAYTNAWGQTVYTGGSGVYDASGKRLPGQVVTAGGVRPIGNLTGVKLKKGGVALPTTKLTATTTKATTAGARSGMSAQSLYQIWKQGGQLTSDEVAKVTEYLQLLKLDQAASGSGGGGGSAREQYAGQSSAKNRYKKMTGGGTYDRMTGKTTY